MSCDWQRAQCITRPDRLRLPCALCCRCFVYGCFPLSFCGNRFHSLELRCSRKLRQGFLRPPFFARRLARLLNRLASPQMEASERARALLWRRGLHSRIAHSGKHSCCCQRCHWCRVAPVVFAVGRPELLPGERERASQGATTNGLVYFRFGADARRLAFLGVTSLLLPIPPCPGVIDICLVNTCSLLFWTYFPSYTYDDGCSKMRFFFFSCFPSFIFVLPRQSRTTVYTHTLSRESDTVCRSLASRGPYRVVFGNLSHRF